MDFFARGHEQIVLRHDPATGLRAIIAIHSTALGPAAGGCRHWVYPDPASALQDALRLAEGMTFKNALADIPFGGGKSVILGRPGQRLDPVRLETFGRWGGCPARALRHRRGRGHERGRHARHGAHHALRVGPG
jgi:glutamate dehydrogenase/leucine dehydrogenase